MERVCPVLGGSGGDRLSRVLRHSTMGAGVFNGRVRDGIGFWAHRSGHQTGQAQGVLGPLLSRVLRRRAVPSVRQAGSGDSRGGRAGAWSCVLRPLPIRCGSADPVGSVLLRRWITRDDQVCRAISTGQLSALPRLHLRPIDVVVFHGPQGRPRFEGGFPLRCLQRLSRPYIAMLHCRWRDNSSTRGTFIPVLSY